MVPLNAANAALLAPYLTSIDAAGLIRQVREQPLGAIVDSTPAMLDPPSLDPPPDPDYPGFAAAHINRRIAHLRGRERRHAARLRRAHGRGGLGLRAVQPAAETARAQGRPAGRVVQVLRGQFGQDRRREGRRRLAHVPHVRPGARRHVLPDARRHAHRHGVGPRAGAATIRPRCCRSSASRTASRTCGASRRGRASTRRSRRTATSRPGRRPSRRRWARRGRTRRWARSRARRATGSRWWDRGSSPARASRRRTASGRRRHASTTSRARRSTSSRWRTARCSTAATSATTAWRRPSTTAPWRTTAGA